MSDVATVPMGIGIEYPEGPKVPEGDLQTRRRLELYSALRGWLEEHPRRGDAWVGSDSNIYYEEGEREFVVAPDLVVAFGIDVSAVLERGTYRVWEAGAPPVFALEIASPSTYKRDLDAKPARFAELGVKEYWRLDPTGGDHFAPALQGDTRRRGRWETIPVRPGDGGGSLTGRSEALGLELHWQPPKLRFYDPAAGAWLLDHTEERQARRAEAAARRAAEDRAKAAEAELGALRRRLGHNPSP